MPALQAIRFDWGDWRCLSNFLQSGNVVLKRRAPYAACCSLASSCEPNENINGTPREPPSVRMRLEFVIDGPCRVESQEKEAFRRPCRQSRVVHSSPPSVPPLCFLPPRCSALRRVPNLPKRTLPPRPVRRRPTHQSRIDRRTSFSMRRRCFS